jgi:hypothetical protein
MYVNVTSQIVNVNDVLSNCSRGLFIINVYYMVVGCDLWYTNKFGASSGFVILTAHTCHLAIFIINHFQGVN